MDASSLTARYACSLVTALLLLCVLLFLLGSSPFRLDCSPTRARWPARIQTPPHRNPHHSAWLTTPLAQGSQTLPSCNHRLPEATTPGGNSRYRYCLRDRAWSEQRIAPPHLLPPWPFLLPQIQIRTRLSHRSVLGFSAYTPSPASHKQRDTQRTRPRCHSPQPPAPSVHALFP